MSKYFCCSFCRPVVNAPTHVDFFRDHGISRVVCGDFHMAALVDGVGIVLAQGTRAF
jgi:hypothetical protein